MGFPSGDRHRRHFSRKDMLLDFYMALGRYIDLGNELIALAAALVVVLTGFAAVIAPLIGLSLWLDARQTTRRAAELAATTRARWERFDALAALDLTLAITLYQARERVDIAQARRVAEEYRHFLILLHGSQGWVSEEGVPPGPLARFHAALLDCPTLWRVAQSALSEHKVDLVAMRPTTLASNWYCGLWSAYAALVTATPDPAIWPAPDAWHLGTWRIEYNLSATERPRPPEAPPATASTRACLTWGTRWTARTVSSCGCCGARVVRDVCHCPSD